MTTKRAFAMEWVKETAQPLIDDLTDLRDALVDIPGPEVYRISNAVKRALPIASDLYRAVCDVAYNAEQTYEVNKMRNVCHGALNALRSCIPILQYLYETRGESNKRAYWNSMSEVRVFVERALSGFDYSQDSEDDDLID